MTINKIDPIDGDCVEVTGMGGAVNVPSAIIQAALELAGYEVEIHNDHNKPGDHWHADKENCKLMLQGKLEFPTNMKRKRKPKVQLIATHIPWPG